MQREERATLALSFLYFFLLLAAYYLIRPVRDALAAGVGAEQIKYLSTAVFITMLVITPLFGALMTRYPRRTVLPSIYAFFIVNLIAFAIVFATPVLGTWPARVFYVWITVFNMFVVSIFWSFMADVWREEQGRRLFGIIAAGGSCGGLIGPLLAAMFAERIGTSGLVILAACFLGGAAACLIALGQRVTGGHSQRAQSLTGSSWQGFLLVLRSPFLLGIGALVFVGAVLAMFAYTEMARLVRETIASPDARTHFYARLDFIINMTALALQALVVGPLTKRYGLAAALVALACIAGVSFIAVGFSPLLLTLAAGNVARRAAEFGLGKPARDMLYTVATPEEKYLAKNMIDTVIYRGGDVVSGWLYASLMAFGVSLAGFGWIGAGGALALIAISLLVVRGYRRRGGR